MSAFSSHTCKNCGSISSGKYCQQCGQRTSIGKVTFLETFQDLIDALFSVNAPLLVTVKGLLVHPGKLLRNYLAGQRKKYYKPVAFFILTTVVYIVLRSLIGFDPFRNAAFQVQDGSSGTHLEDARNFMLFNINNLLFIFVFTLAALSKLFFFQRYSFAEFVAVSFYLLGIYTMLTTVNMFLVEFLGDQMQLVGIAAMFFYFLYAMTSFLLKPRIIIILKSILVYFLAFLTYFIFAFGLSYLIVLLKTK